MPEWLNKVQRDAHNGLVEGIASGSFSRANGMLQKRGVSEADLSLHGIGFAGPSFQVTECAPDFVPWSQQFLHDCLVFPLYNMLGEVVGIQIRMLDDKEYQRPYKQYYAYHRDIFPYFFGLPQALPHVYETGYLVIVEGIFDYFAVRQITPNVMAVLTAGVPIACKRLFHRFCKLVVAMLDMDAPGREGALRLCNEADGYLVTIPTFSEKDPGELLTKGKLKEIQRIVSNTSNLLVR